MRIGWKRFVNTRHLYIKLVVDLYNFVHRVLIAKIFPCLFFGKHCRKWTRQSSLRISFKDFYCKYIKQILISEKDVLFVDEFVIVTKRSNSIIKKSCHFLYFRKICRQVIAKRRRNGT